MGEITYCHALNHVINKPTNLVLKENHVINKPMNLVLKGEKKSESVKRTLS